jgi:tetratricopeptide (TPR) repeat protein
MGRTLNLCDHLLSQGCRYRRVGAQQRALRTFDRIAALRILPNDVAEETQANLAELHLQCGEYAKARRHLTAAISHDPTNAGYYLLMARAHQEDPAGDREQARINFRSGIRRDPDNAIGHCDAGLFALQEGNGDEGIRLLKRAVELAPEDADLLRDVVQGLQRYGHYHEARELATLARFRHSRDRRFLKVWDDCRFGESVRLQQEDATERAPQDTPAACLSFLRLTVETPTGRKLIRRDPATKPAGPHFLRSARGTEKKHA